MNIHKEIKLEDEICEHLAAYGWLYTAKDAADYDRHVALFPADVLAWIQETQPDAWEVLAKNHGDAAGQTLLKRLRDSLDQSGTLHVLRHGFDVLGVKHKMKMAQFKPALAMNPDIVQRYAANRLRVVRQVHYSIHHENNIDLVLLLNGIPVATAELKTDFTQSIDDAVDQYRFDRDPSPKGQNPEPLLSFPSGALVHFAISSSEVKMATKLAGPKTDFLPFNQGSNGPGKTGSAGNPVNPHGHKTAYLWEQVWQRDSWLDILGRYLIAERDDKKNLKAIIFPRFHQLDVTRELLSAVLEEGPGHKYLIQHSAGLDFVNDSEDVLEAFKTYFTTATLEDVTDPNIVLNLRTKLDAYGFYDEPEIDRVVAVELDPNAKQKQLEAAIAPVADRLLRQFAAAKVAFKDAEAEKNESAAKTAKDKMNALLLFRADVATYQRVYTFLSQIFDYGNTDFEKRSIFFGYLLRLLKFGREREGVDLSQVVLTHHTLRNKGQQAMKLADEKYPELKPLSEAGSGEVRDAKKAYLNEIIAKINDLFKGDLTVNDKLVYVNNVIMGKLLESETLAKQAANNTKEQFANSPDLKSELVNAIIEALDAHTVMSSQALGSEEIQSGLREILLGPGGLYEQLRTPA